MEWKKKWKKNGMENNGENSGPLTSLPVDRLMATDCNAAARAKVKTTSMMRTTSSMNKTLKMETCNIEGCIVYYLKKMLTTPHLYSHSKTDPKPEVLSAV